MTITVAMRLLVLITFIVLGSSISLKAQVGDLHLKITDIEMPSGRIQIGIYNHADDFPTEGKEYKIIYLQVDGNEIAHTVKGLPQGDYAVAFYHDTNMDSICNLNFLGIPKEGYGFSRNYRPRFRAPVFEETVITVGDSTYVEMVPIY
jgi:uncharacterized protein (DUF2141 family)